MCQNKTLSHLQTASIEQFSQKASLAASAPHLIDDFEQQQPPETADKQQQTASQSQQTNAQQTDSQPTSSQQQPSTSQQTSQQQQQKPIHPPLPHHSDFASTTSLATSTISQMPNLDTNYAYRSQLYPQQYLPHPRNLSNINNHNLNRRLPNPNLNTNNATSNSHLALKRLYRVLYPYKPKQADELELIAGAFKNENEKLILKFKI